MKWSRIRVRVKEPNSLQKPRASLRFRMTHLRQGRQRPKIFLLFDWTRKKSPFLQPKSEAGVGRIRFLVRQNLDFVWRRMSPICRLGFLIAGIIHTYSIAARAILAWLPLEQVCGLGISASSFPSLVPSILTRLLLEQDCGSGVSASSSLPPPVPSTLAWLLLKQDWGFNVLVGCFL